jgi:hypothetical protein
MTGHRNVHRDRVEILVAILISVVLAWILWRE